MFVTHSVRKAQLLHPARRIDSQSPQSSSSPLPRNEQGVRLALADEGGVEARSPGAAASQRALSAPSAGVLVKSRA